MMFVPIADALMIYWIIGIVVVPVVVGAYAFVAGLRANSGFGKRTGMELVSVAESPIVRSLRLWLFGVCSLADLTASRWAKHAV